MTDINAVLTLLFKLEDDVSKNLPGAKKRLDAYFASLDQATQDQIMGVKDLAKADEDLRKSQQDTIDSYLKGMKAAHKESQQVQTQWRRMQFAVRGVVETGQTFAVASGAAIAGMMLAANAYVDSVKASTEATRDWKLATQSLKDSQSEVGRVLATEALPYLRSAATLMQHAAAFAEKHPGAIEGIFAASGVILAASAIVLAVGKGFRVYANVEYIMATFRERDAAREYAAAVLQFDAGVTTFATAVEAQAAANALAMGGVSGKAALGYGVTGGLVGPALAGAAGAATTLTAAQITAMVGTGGVAGLTLNKAGKIIDATTKRYVSSVESAARATEAKIAIDGTAATVMGKTVAEVGALGSKANVTTAALGQGGWLGALKQMPLYMFGSQKDLYGTEEQQQFARDQAEEWSVDLKAQQEAAGGFWKWLKGLILGDPAIKDPYDALRAKQGAEAGGALGVTGPGTAGPLQGTLAYIEQFATDNDTLWRNYVNQQTDINEQAGKQRVQIEDQYEKQRTQILRDEAIQRARIQDDYDRSVDRAWRDFEKSESDIENDYYERRLKAAKDYSKKLFEMEQDHQIQMRRDLEDHEDTQRSLLESRDGMAMIREDQRYEKERQRKEEDYILNVSRLNVEQAEKLRENEKNFAEERAQRLAAFELRLADQQFDYDLARQREKDDQERRAQDAIDAKDAELKMLEDNRIEQLKRLETTFKRQLEDLDGFILGDYDAWHTAVMQRHADFVVWMQGVQGGIAQGVGEMFRLWGQRERIPTNAAGGYLGYGAYIAGEEGAEFLLSNRTTRIAEQRIGTKLNQDNILTALSGGQGKYADNRVMYFSGVTEQDRAAFRREMLNIARAELVEAIR